jgi:hypothetical protein
VSNWGCYDPGAYRPWENLTPNCCGAKSGAYEGSTTTTGMLQRGATTTRDAGFMQFCRSPLRCGTSSDSSREYLTPYTIEGLRLSQVLLSIKGVFHHLLGSTFCICGMFQGGCLQKGPDARAQEANAEGTEQWIKLLIVTVTGLMREPRGQSNMREPRSQSNRH